VDGAGHVYGLKPEYIKFAAAKFQLGGHGSRQNSLAASLAGIEATPSAAFRIARSVGVQKLLDEAKKIQAGKAPRVTDAEISQRIDLMIKSPDHRAAAVGIELLAKRDERAARSRDDLPSDPREVISLILADMGAEGVVSAAELWFTATSDLLGCPHFELIAPVIHGRFPDLWQRYRAPIAGRVEFFKGSEQEQHFLAAFDAAGLAPEPTDADFRAALGAAAKPRANGNGAAFALQREPVVETSCAEVIDAP
jgi:hypothetical protein